MIPEKEREALMRLTMCAREECIMCKYHKECDFDYQYETATRCMNILADALRKDDPSDSEKPNNCEYCKWWFGYCHLEECEYEPKDEPQTEQVGVPFGEMDEATFKSHCLNCQRDTADIKCLDCDGNKYFLPYGSKTDCAWK